MRRASKIDANQPEIVQALRDAGCTVQPLHHVGDGCPDLLVGRDGINYLLEVKDLSQPPSASKLNARQRRWHDEWRGAVKVVRCVEAALEAVGLTVTT